MNDNALLSGKLNGDRLELAAGGDWTADNAAALDALVTASAPASAAIRNVEIDMGGIVRLDTYGAWLLERIIRSASEKGAQARVLRLPAPGLEETFQAGCGRARAIAREKDSNAARRRWHRAVPA